MIFSDFGSLPIDTFLETIADQLIQNGRLVLAAETGAGKTTRVPPYLLSRLSGKILVLEPRRLAATLTASHCAEVMGEEIGQTVGYHIRHQYRATKNTRLVFITEAMLLRYLQSDPMLSHFQAVVIDEFHERNLYTDLALSLIQTLRLNQRPDLKLLVMSATMDSQAVSHYLDDAKILQIPGRTFPLKVEYCEPRNSDSTSKIVEIVEVLQHSKEYPGNILLFSIGAGEIIRLQNELIQKLNQDIWEIVPLFSDMSKASQQRAFSAGKRKIILATNVAETSITLPNITTVIDLGEAKIAAITSWSGMSTLETMRVSKASCEQRAGRAGRTAEGLVYRLYSRADFMLRSDFTAPDIERLDLSQTCLDLLSLGFDPQTFPWFTLPKKENLELGLHLLKMLEIMNQDESRLTTFGENVSKLPIHPRFGAMVMKSKEMGIISHGIYAAAILSENEILKEPASSQIDERDIKKNRENSCDLLFRIKLIKEYLTDRRSTIRFLFHEDRLKRVLDLTDLLHRQLQVKDQLMEEVQGESDLWQAILFAFIDRVAKKQEQMKKQFHAQYHFCMGKGGSIAPSSVLYQSTPLFVIALDSTERLKGNAAKGIQVRMASSICLEQLQKLGGKLIRREMSEELDQAKGKLRFFQTTYYGKITISSKQLGSSEVNQSRDLDQVIKDSWPYPFTDLTAWESYHAKISLLDRFHINHHLPRFDGELFDLFLQSITEGVSDLKVLGKESLKDLLWQQLGELERYQLNNFTPDMISLDNGTKLSIVYDVELGPIVEAPLQQFYGLEIHPTIAEGKIPITLRFLSPAKRLLQTSSDLPNFWMGSYHAIAKELRAKYPKHHWPENPAQAEKVFLKYQLSKK